MNTGVGADALILFPVMLCIAYSTSSIDDTWVFLLVRLFLILCISSTGSCSLHYNENIV